jgi:DnaJ homolog subfamily C member 11
LSAPRLDMESDQGTTSIYSRQSANPLDVVDLGSDVDSDTEEARARVQRLTTYPDEVDFYSLLGLSKSPPPSDAQIRTAYRTLTLSFHPDKQPTELREAAERYFESIREAYETLIDPEKRVVYDLLGADGVKREWGKAGLMANSNKNRAQSANENGRASLGQATSDDWMEVGPRAMNPDEFRIWFLKRMKERERGVLEDLVGARVRTKLFLCMSMLRQSRGKKHETQGMAE